MKDKKVQKGQYGYISNQRGRAVGRTVFLFALSLTILAAGILYKGDKKNLLTVVAILGCLPASKSAVNMIMFLKAKGCSEQVFLRTVSYDTALNGLYDLFFTSYKQNYQVSHMVIKGKIICGYTEDMKTDIKACEKHIDSLLKQGGCQNITVKIFNEAEKYYEGLDNLQKQPLEEEEGQQEQFEDILTNLLAISL